MDDMETFERRVAHEVNRGMGPSEPVDDAAIFAATTTATTTLAWTFQTMLSANRFLVAGAILALFGGLLLVVQPFDQREASAPGAATDAAVDAEDARVAVVTGHLETGLWQGGFGGQSLPLIDGMDWRHHDMDQDGRLEMGDARLSGDVTFTLNIDGWSPDVARLPPPDPSNGQGVQLWWGTMRIENDGGTWEGTHLSWEPQRYDRPYVGPVMHLTGSGDYEGMSAILYRTEGFAGVDAPERVDGIIFPGDLPPSDRRGSHEQGIPVCISDDRGELVPNPDLDGPQYCPD